MQDIFASEVFSLLSREPELSHLLFQYLKLQAQFHKQAFEQLEAALPKLQEVICKFIPLEKCSLLLTLLSV